MKYILEEDRELAKKDGVRGINLVLKHNSISLYQVPGRIKLVSTTLHLC